MKVVKAVLWITTLVFGSLFGLTLGLLFGVIFGLGLTVGWDGRTGSQQASTNSPTPAATAQTVDLKVPNRLATAAAH
jgi:hypothetical protein